MATILPGGGGGGIGHLANDPPVLAGPTAGDVYATIVGVGITRSRLAAVSWAPAVLALLHIHLRIHHHFHGPPFDYVGLAAAAAASWIGVPGPGEPVLIAAGISAAHHHLDIFEVVIVAWVAAMAGGVGGWLIGLKAGRALFTAPGPLRKLRLRTVQRGEEVFRRYTVIAIVFTPSWISGIHGVRSAVYQPVNAAGALVWACLYGLGAYFAGPAVIDQLQDVGLVTAVGLVALIGVGITLEVRRRRGRAPRER